MLLVSSAGADDAESIPHLRPLDRGLRELIAIGVRDSPSFRALVERINASDVIVYVRCGRHLRPGVTGQMTFAGSSAGFRYIVVAIEPVGFPERRLATLGHELRHAVEVADTPSIVDVRSLGVAYGQMGRSSRLGVVTIFDTDAAIETGVQVWREVAGGKTTQVTQVASGAESE